jgi:hypothetical protein
VYEQSLTLVGPRSPFHSAINSCMLPTLARSSPRLEVDRVRHGHTYPFQRLGLFRRCPWKSGRRIFDPASGSRHPLRPRPVPPASPESVARPDASGHV